MAQSNIPYKCPNGEFSCIDVDPNGILNPECSSCSLNKILDPRKAAIISTNHYLNENIKIAAEQFTLQRGRGKEAFNHNIYNAFEQGALSQQAKEYWFAEFKREEALKSVEGISETFPFEGKDEKIKHGIGVVGHGPIIFGCDARHSGKTQSLREIIQGIEGEGVKVVVVGRDDLPEILKGSSEVHEFTRRPEIIMPAPNFKDEDFILTSCTSQYIPNKEVKPYDRKAFPNKMNNYKSKKRNKR